MERVNKVNNEQALLQYYRDNSSFIHHNIFSLMTYISMTDLLDGPSDEEYQIISSAAYNAYMKDEYHLDLLYVTDQLSNFYKRKLLTLEDMQNISSRDLLQMVMNYEEDEEIDMQL